MPNQWRFRGGATVGVAGMLLLVAGAALAVDRPNKPIVISAEVGHGVTSLEEDYDHCDGSRTRGWVKYHYVMPKGVKTYDYMGSGDNWADIGYGCVLNRRCKAIAKCVGCKETGWKYLAPPDGKYELEYSRDWVICAPPDTLPPKIDSLVTACDEESGYTMKPAHMPSSGGALGEKQDKCDAKAIQACTDDSDCAGLAWHQEVPFPHCYAIKKSAADLKEKLDWDVCLKD